MVEIRLDLNFLLMFKEILAFSTFQNCFQDLSWFYKNNLKSKLKSKLVLKILMLLIIFLAQVVRAR